MFTGKGDGGERYAEGGGTLNLLAKLTEGALSRAQPVEEENRHAKR